jgi:hypothetical protein
MYKYLPTFGWFLGQILVNIPYMEHMGIPKCQPMKSNNRTIRTMNWTWLHQQNVAKTRRTLIPFATIMGPCCQMGRDGAVSPKKTFNKRNNNNNNN